MLGFREKQFLRSVTGFLTLISAALAASSPVFSEAAFSPSLFTAAQADRGAAIYASQCATCHGNQLQGGAGPALVGSTFFQLAAAQNLTVKSLFDTVSTTMPMTMPGSLRPNEYEDLVAFLLRANGYAAGNTPLSNGGATLSQVKLAQAITGDAGNAVAVTHPASVGVYTAAQAAHGKVIYDDNCALCHGGSLRGVESAPALVGESFMTKWGAGTVGAVYAFIDQNMPPGNGGELGPDSEADIVAYILSQNQYSAGYSPLPADSTRLNAITMK